jgi:hypothetical protein
MSACLGFVLLAGVVGQPAPATEDYYTSLTASARELSRALDLLQRSFVTIADGDQDGRGLYQQMVPIRADALYLRQQIGRKVSRDDLQLAFAKVDDELNRILGDLTGIEKWAPAVRMAARRLHQAQHDVHYALAASNEDPAKQAEVAYRQILALKTRVEDLHNLVKYLFTEQDAVAGWNAGFAELRGAVNDLQRTQKDKAPRAELTGKMQKVADAWEKLVARAQALPESQYLLLRADFAQADQVFARLERLYGIPQTRPPLKEAD